MDVVVGHGDRAAFFNLLNFGDVAGFGLFFGEGAFGAVSEASVAEGARGDDSDNSEDAREVMFEIAEFAPRVEAVKEDAFLAGGD